MKKLILLLFICNITLFAQSNFTVEWQNPSGQYYSGYAQGESTNSIPEIILNDGNNYYVYDGATKQLKHAYGNTTGYYFFYKNTLEDDNELDANNDGSYDLIGTKFTQNPTQTILKVLSGSDGSVLFQKTYNDYQADFRVVDIDGDGYLELFVILYNPSTYVASIEILSTQAHAISVNEDIRKIHSFKLRQNYPNPFNPNTIVEYSLSKESEVKIILYDVMGREVRTLVNEKKKQGDYAIHLDGEGLSSGTYFYQISIDGNSDTKKMVLLK